MVFSKQYAIKWLTTAPWTAATARRTRAAGRRAISLLSSFLSLGRGIGPERAGGPDYKAFILPRGWSSSSRGVNRVIPAIPIPSSGQSPTFPCSLARVAIHPGEEKKIKQHSSIWNFFSREKGNNCGGQKEENEQTGEERTGRGVSQNDRGKNDIDIKSNGNIWSTGETMNRIQFRKEG